MNCTIHYVARCCGPRSLVCCTFFMLAFFSTLALHTQTIWLENFSGANQGWNANFTDCDGTPQSFAGVQNNRFEVTDMEGAPCCAVGGGHDNDWTTNDINIAGYCNVTVSVDLGTIGTLECFGGPYYGCTGAPSIDDDHDQLQFEYRVDGGAWILVSQYCGGTPASITVSSAPFTGSLLQIRGRMANNNTNETYWFDNVKVTGTLPTVNQPANITVCSNQLVNVNFTGSAGATFSWVTNNPAIGLAPSGNGNISFTTASLSSQEVATVAVTPNGVNCQGVPVQFTITVQPVPISDFIPFVTACSGDLISIQITGTPGATFTWTNSNPLIGLPAIGSGSISFTGANLPGYLNQTGFINVTPHLGTCVGPTQEFTITVSPHPVLPMSPDITVCAGDLVLLLPQIPPNPPGGICCQGNAWFFLSWTNDNPDIGIGDVFYGQQTLHAANVSVPTTGNLTVSGDVMGCKSVPPSISFSITVNPKPIMAPMDDWEICGNELLNLHFASGTNPVFTWTNGNPAIGLTKQGVGDISFTSADVTQEEVGTITLTATENGCKSVQNFDITVKPVPRVDQLPDITVCGGEPVEIFFTGTADAVFNWDNDNWPMGSAPYGQGDFHFNAADVTTTMVGVVTVVPFLDPCYGTPMKFKITVRPTPKVKPPADITACEGTPINVNFVGTPANSLLEWTNTNTATGLGPSGVAGLHFTAAKTNVTQSGTVTVTPSLNGCVGIPQELDVTVYHIPLVADPPDTTACAGEPLNINFTSTGADPTYDWTNTNSAIGLFTSGSGPLDFIAGSPSGTQTGVITVSASENGCKGPSQSFKIAVSAVPSIIFPQPDLEGCTGTTLTTNFIVSPGATVYWTNSDSTFGLAGSGTGNIVFTIPPVTKTDTAVITYYPKTGPCPGEEKTFTIIVHPNPILYNPGNLTVCAGTPIDIAFSGVAGSTFSWINSDTAIGLPLSGSGNIAYTAPFVSSSASSSITVTAFLGQCQSSPQSFTLTVNPGAGMANPGDQAWCGGDPATVLFAGVGNTVFSWTNSNPGIGLAASGSGNLNFTASIADTVQTATVTVVPLVGVCAGPPQTFNIAINPGVSVSPPGDQSACVGDLVNVVFAGSGNPNFNWVNDNPAIGLGSSGSGNISFTAPSLATPQTAHITVTPSGTGCPGAAQTFAITVGPTPTVSLPGPVGVCSGLPIGIDFNNSPGAQIQWSNSNPAIGLGSSGSGNIAFTAANVASPQTGTITATPVLGSCSGSPVHFGVTVYPPANAGITGDLSLCAGESTTLSASGGNSFVWSTSDGASSITIQPGGSNSYSVTVTNADGCTATAAAYVEVHPLPAAVISGSTSLCLGAATTLSASGGLNYDWNTSANTADITVNPALSTSYTVTVSDAFSCTAVASVGVQVLLPDAVTINATSCDPTSVGTQVQTLQNINGCDSVVTTITALLPSSTVSLSAVTCNPNQAGTFTQHLSNVFGCDSTVVTTIVYDPSIKDTVYLTAASCDQAQTGVAEVLLTGFDGCDSLVITTTSLLPSHTIHLTAKTCNPNQTGIFTQFLVNQYGCDSTVTTTVSFDPSVIDTVYLTAASCDPTQTGISQLLLSGADGCDSLLITTTALLPESTVHLTAKTCDPSQAGVFTQTLSNQFGCDSTVITTVTLSPENTVHLTAKTCDPSQAGVFTQTLTNQFGCDSTVITTVTLSPENTVNLTAKTCDPSQAGVFTQTLSNQFGCDTTVITTVTLLPESTVNLTAKTCDPSQAGVFTQTLSNQFGCDSTVITTVTLLPESSIALTATTCDSSAAGSFVQVLQNQFGCDSIVTTTVLYNPLLCGPVVSVSASDPGCNQGDNGVFEVSVLSGQPPLAYAWSGSGRSGSGQITDLSSPLRVEQLPAGQYSITITDLSNQTTTVATATLQPATIPEIHLPADTVIVQGHSLRIEAVTNVSNWQTLVWHPLPDSACASCLVQEWTPLKNTFLSVTVTDFAGCKAEASIRIFVKKLLELYVPNVFSPDDDGVNDIWLLNAGPSVPELEEVLIFDRWGDLHYQWRSALPPNEWPGWDGTVRGQKATPGVYVYALKVKMADGEILVVKGDLTLLK